MQILVDNGAHTLRNMGDVAMLQATRERLRQLYPAAKLCVLTHDPALLRRYCPGTTPLSVASRDAAFSAAGRSNRHQSFWRRLLRSRKPTGPNPEEFRAQLAAADRVVVAGGGFLNDLNAEATRIVFRMLAEAGRQGKPVALFSQGLGPLEDPALLHQLQEVCATGAWLGLREGRRGPEIAARAKARPGRVGVTGDDALEAAWRLEPQPGEALGFSMRQIGYSGIEPPQVDRLSNGLRLLRSRLKTEVLPLPVSFNSFENDAGAIRQVTGEPFDEEGLDDPSVLIVRAGRARVVLTGTYHAAVFALAQGVPCVCFHASPYYRDKLEGLAAQFPQGCRIIDLGAPDCAELMARETENLWNQAPGLRAVLRQCAAVQVQAAQVFYREALTGN